VEIPEENIKLKEPIKKIGEHEIELVIGKKVVKFKLDVADAKARQAKH
jgi:ribosomal protein L9